jgi:acetyl/propionyl-CoA carboxylase alpha subunit
MTFEVELDGQARLVSVEAAGEGRFRVSWDGHAHEVDLQRPTPEAFQMLIDGESWEAGCVRVEGGWLVDVMGVTEQVGVVDPRRKALRLAGAAAGGQVNAPMPGRVVRLCASAGAAVKKGQPLLVVEAMKMENELKSPIDGVLVELWVTEGQAVEAGSRLARVE